MLLTEELRINYSISQQLIKQRLEDFKKVPESDYFYELAYCILTPQSKARHADAVVSYMKSIDFFNKPMDISGFLRQPKNYIRFHNTKAKRLIDLVSVFEKILQIIHSSDENKLKRLLIKSSVNGFGMKEASHFLRNIGFQGLAILDRHILKNLVLCGVFENIPNVSNEKAYLTAETKFEEFAEKCDIPIDELDLLFWSAQTGEILK